MFPTPASSGSSICTQLEELTLDATEAITDAAASYLRANKHLRKLVLRGTDITDVGMPYLAALTGLKSLDLSHTMVGDVGLESLPALSELEELDLGGTRITGINLNFLKLLPKLKKLSFNGIQRRNAGACWTPLITDLDLDTISLLSGLEDLNLGVGVSLGRTGRGRWRGKLPCHRRHSAHRSGRRQARETDETAAARYQRRKDHSGGIESSEEPAAA